VGAFLDAQLAKKAAANLKARSYDAYILKTVDSQDRTWLRVRFGAYTTEQKARASALAFERKVGIPALVVRKPKPPVPVAKQ
jgi:cell division septation protein DedD